MSLIKSATRRLSLLAGSSLVAAGLATAGSMGVALAPGVASAQAVCVPVPTTGAGTNSVTYVAGTYNPGIICTASGGAMTVTTGGAVTVSTTAGGNGVNLTATTETINWNSTAGTLSGGAQTNGAIIEANTTTGAINIDTVAVTRTTGSTQTHGILARSTGGGSITLNTGIVNVSSGATNSVGIEAITSGGNGNIVINAASSGRLYGILAQAAGSGSIQITGSGSAGSGIAAIQATTASGDITYTVGGGISTQNQDSSGGGFFATSTSGRVTVNALAANIVGSHGSAVRAQTGGDVMIEVGAGRMIASRGSAQSTLGPANAAIDLTLSSGADASIVNAGQIKGGWRDAGPGNSAAYGTLALRASGTGALTFDNDGLLLGRLELASLSGGTTLTIGAGLAETGGWRTGGTSTFGGGADSVTVEEGGVIVVSPRGVNVDPVLGPSTMLDFGGGADALENSGTLIIGPRDPGQGATSSYLSLTGLEAFNNAGVIYFGALFPTNSIGATSMTDPANADQRTDDVLRMDGGVFTGLEGSRLILDADLTKIQANCIDRDADGLLPAADCLDFRGASTEGETLVTIKNFSPTVRGAYNPAGIVIVDVRGAGASALGHFILAPDSTGYSAEHGGIIDKGEFFYTVVYDEELQQHKLVGLPGQNLFQLPGVAIAAQSVWRTATENVISRPGERRLSADGDGLGGDLWLRATGDFGARDVEQSLEFSGVNFDFDNSYDQQTVVITGGGDMAWGTANTSYLVGAALGAARTDLEYDASPNTVEMRGFTIGAYGGMTMGAFYLDAAVNGVGMTMENDMPALGLLPVGRLLTTKLQTVGLQAEAGWRMPLSEMMFVEPLVGLSFAETKFDDLNIGVSGDFLFPGNVGEFEKLRTARAGAGARFGTDADYGGVLMRFLLTGRVWHETDGESAVNVLSAGPDYAVNDALTGTFSDIVGALALSDDAGAFSAFVEAGGKFGDDYQSTSVSGGVRYRW